MALRFLRRLACAGTVADGRARCALGEGRCADPFNVRCTNSSPCDLAKPALAAFGMDSARTKTHGQDPQVRATNVVCIPLLIPQPDRERYQFFSVS